MIFRQSPKVGDGAGARSEMSALSYETPLHSERPPAEGRRFLRIIPLAFITYSLAYLDRVNYGFAAAGGLEKDLGITAQINAILPAIFFIGYFPFQIPGTAYAAHRSVRKLIFWALLLWGLLSMATGVVKNVPALLVIRLMLGVVEGVVYPSMLVFVSHWFTKREKSRANTLLICGNSVTMAWASIVSGSVIAFFNYHAFSAGAWHPKGWQMMFVLEGLPSVIWAFCWWFMAADHPHDASWLTTREADAVQAMLDAEQKGLPPVKDYWTAFTDPRVMLFCALFFFWSVGIYGFVFWVPKIIKFASHTGIGTTGLLTSVPYIVGTLAMIGVSYFSDRSLVRKAFVWPPLLIGAIASLAVATSSHFLVIYIGLIIAGACMYAPYGPFWAMVPEMVPRAVVGESMALINSVGAVGGLVGTYVIGWLSSKGSPAGAFLFAAVCLAASVVLTLIVRPELQRMPKPPKRGCEVVPPGQG
jgi:sugar phosphate permease